MSKQKAVLDPKTGQFEMVEMTADDLKEQADRVEAPDIVQEQIERMELARLAVKAAFADLPGADDIRNAKGFAEQQDMLLKLHAAVTALGKHLGFEV